VWWRTTIILAPGRLRQEDHKFESSLGYIGVGDQMGYVKRLCLKINKQKWRNQ
jgi:hypothetical protein